jgi:hypothetical protein
MELWHDFFVAVAGASAALTGLIFVGVSLSLSKILIVPRLADRAFQALILLLNILIASCLCLAPELSQAWLGTYILIMGIALWFTITLFDIAIYRATDRPYKRHYSMMMPVNQFATIPYIISGVVVLNSGFEGIHWLLPAVIFSFVKSVIDAWVILVEIHR